MLDVSCYQCRTQRFWLSASGNLDRDGGLANVVEPSSRGVRKHVTGDDDPARGRLARPEHLQLCLVCGELRGPYDGYDNLCRCDRAIWDREPVPIFGDLANNIHLCWSCVIDVVRSGTRWSPYYCATCRPAVVVLRRLAGRNVVPLGPHSLMNGISRSSSDCRTMTDHEAVALSEQLNALFADQRTLAERTRSRTLDRARRVGFTGHAVLVDDYRGACWEADITVGLGFIEFLVQLGANDGAELANEIWRLTDEQST